MSEPTDGTMNPTMNIRILIALLASVAFAAPASAQNVLTPDGNESAGVQSRRGNASPAGGFSTGETNSRIDDYINQDEQINIDPDSGVVKVLRTNQKNLINDYVTELVPLYNVWPREIRNALRTAAALEGGRVEVVRDPDNKKNYMQLIVPKFMLPKFREAVRALDDKWILDGRDGSDIITYFPKYRDATELDAIAVEYAGEGVTLFDTFGNSVTRRDEPYRTDKYLKACKFLDIPPPQAHFEFKIYEINTNNDLNLGVDWIAWKNGPGRSLFEAVFGGLDSREAFSGATGNFNPTQNTTVLGDGYIQSQSTQLLLSANYVLTSAFLDFLQVVGKARVLAEADIFARNAQIGTWSSVDQFLSFEVTPDDPAATGINPQPIANFDPSVTEDGQFPAVHNRFLNHNIGPTNQLGMTLNVFPIIGTESSEVEVEFISDDLAGETPQGTPIITHRRVVTKLRLVDGEPFVFGGLTRQEEVKGNKKAPWLGDIPVLGYLFGEENTVARRKELIVTVIPHFYYGAPAGVEEQRARDTIAMVKREKPIEMPPLNCFGFDKWFYDGTLVNGK